MSEIKVTSEVARKEEPAVTPYWEPFASLFPVRSFFGANPFMAMNRLNEEIERMMGTDVFGTELKAWTPAIDIHRANGDLEIAAELPGLKAEEVKVEVTEGALTIRGERKRETKEEKEGYHRYERSYGSFYRAIPMPKGAKAEAVKAELSEGVLKIHVPLPEAKPSVREIPVGTK